MSGIKLLMKNFIIQIILYYVSRSLLSRKNKSGKDNPPPKICSELWLKKEIELVNCKLYVIVGSKAAKFIFPDQPFEKLVFKNNTFNNKLALVLPHPSPVNIKWFMDHPEFEEKRIPEIRKIIKEVLNS